MQICFLYFCRITEVLNARVSDIIEPDRVVLHGAKRSYSYVVYLPGLSKQVLLSKVESNEVPLFPVSYIKLYRDAVRVGINVRVKDSSNSRRLHCSRYVFSQQSIKSINGSELADVLRHRSKQNYLSYLK
jgi:integrase